MNRTLLFALLPLWSCSPAMTGDASLALSLSVAEVDYTGSVTVVRVVATDAAGLVGTGTVTLRSSAGSAATEQEQPLDAFGVARFEFSCALASDSNCVGDVTLTASWTANGERITAMKRVPVVPPTLQLRG